jgi:hypothetical protein
VVLADLFGIVDPYCTDRPGAVQDSFSWFSMRIYRWFLCCTAISLLRLLLLETRFFANFKTWRVLSLQRALPGNPPLRNVMASLA